MFIWNITNPRVYTYMIKCPQVNEEGFGHSLHIPNGHINQVGVQAALSSPWCWRRWSLSASVGARSFSRDSQESHMQPLLWPHAKFSFIYVLQNLTENSRLSRYFADYCIINTVNSDIHYLYPLFFGQLYSREVYDKCISIFWMNQLNLQFRDSLKKMVTCHHLLV